MTDIKAERCDICGTPVGASIKPFCGCIECGTACCGKCVIDKDSRLVCPRCGNANISVLLPLKNLNTYKEG